MPFPKTIESLKTCGYEEKGDGHCRGCGADITWWKSPTNRLLPMNLGTAEPHWGTCPNADQFRKGKK